MKFKDYTLDRFTKDLGSSLPAPGGGGVGGLLGSQGAALTAMVCQLTMGKRKYQAYEEEIQKINTEALEDMNRYLAMMDEDRDNFLPLSQAYGLPTGTEEERAHKAKLLEETTLIALTTPRDCLALAEKSMGMLLRLVDIGSRLAISDVGVGAECVMAAAKTSLWNIYINTRGLAKEDVAQEINREAEEVLGAIERNYGKIQVAMKKLLKK